MMIVAYEFDQLPGQAQRLFRTVLAVLARPGAYDRRHCAIAPDRQSFVTDRKAVQFSLTGLIERAAAVNASVGSNAVFLKRGDPAIIFAAKAFLCRRIGAIHLDLWEEAERPTQDDLRDLFHTLVSATPSPTAGPGRVP
ncbi:MAG: hypothetical protein JWQ16_1757 [Novosphingobium sp.]|nr:hypothetical protein [Novosphingobium sp.]